MTRTPEEGADAAESAPSASSSRAPRGGPLGLIARLYRRPVSAIGATLVFGFFLLALFGPWIAPFTATEQNFQSPLEGPSSTHLFGTDRFGRDVFSRVVVGTRSIFALAGFGTLLGVLLGTGFGLLSGFRGGWFDEILMRVFDSILAIPALLLALLLLGTIGSSSYGVLFVIAAVYTPIVARVVRSEVLAIKTRDYVEAARLQGESTLYILTREILPGVLPALSVEAALRFSYAIFLVASLGFLGVGVQPPTPNWGLMVKAARDFAEVAPWWLLFPAGAISVLVVGMNLLADGLKRVLQSPEALSTSGSTDAVSTRTESADPSESTGGLAAPEATVLALRNVTVAYESQGRELDAVRDVTLTIEPGETLGLVGESGSGKSTLAHALMRYLPANGRVRRGRITFDGRELLDLGERELQDLWGKDVSLVPQNPSASLNPSLRIGEQIAELLRRHTDLTDDDVQARIVELLDQVRIGDPERVARSYPHQLSGGMQQRAMIAMALSTSPKLLVMDEPTTGLDVTTEAAVLDLMDELIAERDTAMLYISHDLGVVARVADRVAVLYAGELVETARTDELYEHPLHPYTQGLLDSVPRLGERKGAVRLSSMQGRIPAPSERPGGCVFAPRCPVAIDRCRPDRPSLDLTDTNDGANGRARHVRCHRWREIARGDLDAGQRRSTSTPASSSADRSDTSILNIDRLRVHFPVKRSLTEVLRRRPTRLVRAVDGVGLSVRDGETLGLVGESGSGKTTLARAVLGLVAPSEGAIRLQGDDLPNTLGDRDLDVLRHLQLVSQNPEEALNPYQTVGEILERPLRRLQGQSTSDARRSVVQLLNWVRLGPEYAPRLPAQLSGGEKQRVAIARAFAARPELVVCDEPTSALDVSVQARILNLLTDLQSEGGGAYLFISHDLAVVGYLADTIAVVYLGRLMDVGGRETFFEPPYHPYTEALLSSVPQLDPAQTSARVHLDGEIPSPTDVPSGCPFHTRCPRYLGDVCRTEAPPVRETADGRRIACHIPLEQLERAQTSLASSPAQRPETTEEAGD